MIEHPHLAARSAFPRVPHAGAGSVRVTAPPFHVDGRPIAPGGPAPYLVGEHTHEVLAGVLGYSDERIAELERAGAVQAAEGT